MYLKKFFLLYLSSIIPLVTVATQDSPISDNGNLIDWTVSVKQKTSTISAFKPQTLHFQTCQLPGAFEPETFIQQVLPPEAKQQCKITDRSKPKKTVTFKFACEGVIPKGAITGSGKFKSVNGKEYTGTIQAEVKINKYFSLHVDADHAGKQVDTCYYAP
ncbi:DUF3617 domain-containing protein [Candidatus Nitrosacidococcus tergens]|uniref:DUF3617 family protein n=1 Tax=Candidatus Nitrosacidococcus tergens TaxID=553981 RepID=A0A7G1QBC7_9GAMM|nr:hypothetical protein [Candidatus Nitrosacidococcus tergens]CAB1277313.1 exported protein of unknown function [Candidatus Nitrosacidococcus tergens]